ncbi:hypothetical protein BCR41DRAFT_424322 [Lobosporangium transversale]|uniref:Uncharacterized protein n=1 Tax=Lobosporangium transversale TaxID=64571 RepID=A0A1Y2GEI6_9FUNG|nr:hypothetical protein BCR41DRAFT_424322 [Lobosporangium transversale]ORZ08734.1 hypothetical protein BCR41DRAFT_424322 [Lobosporangium transversale]|eukprot:XP_021878517.1 hypothetical protein BCR41DRAFT_424322 [Lobosporangium transversale]
MTGADDQQTKLATVSSDVNGGTTKDVKYKVPFVYPPGQIYFLMFQTKNQNATTWATRFTITDINGNHGMLHPVIPPGGKINPGGLGQIISAEKAQELSEGNKASPKMSTHGNVNSNSNRNSPDSSSPAYLHGVAKSSLGRGVDSTGLTNNAGSLSSSKGTSLDTGAHSGQSDQANNITRNSGISSTASSFVIAAAIFFTALMGF